MTRFPFRLAVLASLAALGAPACAHADPVSIAIAITTALPFVSAAVDTLVFYASLAGISAAATWALTKLATPKNRASAQERAASVAQLQLGETARELILGEVGTAGSLADAFNFGGKYGTDWEGLVIVLADHRCAGLTGFYIGDAYYDFAGDGVQPGFNNQLELYFYDGALDQAASARILTDSGGRWTSVDRLAGLAYVYAKYKADDPKSNSPIWSTGRPAFLWKVKGALLYDARKDSTVSGGAGAHRWDDPATREWSDNAIVGRYNYNRGIYAGDQVSTPSALIIGRGLSAAEAPPERTIAAANLCDELVELKAGGTEARYRVNGVIRADEPFVQVEEMFAAAMGGTIVQRDGGVEVEPGAAKSAVASIGDLDLLVGQPIRVDSFVSDNDRVNTVTPRYVEPSQLYRDTAAPIRRSTADLVSDGGLREKSISLSLVTSQTQAQRCGEIERRLSRKERRATVVVGPRFSHLEDGDWITWTSDRYLLGSSVTFRIEAVSVAQDYKTTLVLREIAASCYAWTPASDEATPGQAPIDEAGSLDPLELSGVVFSNYALTGDDGSVLPAIKAQWDAPVDVAVWAVRLDIRQDPTSPTTSVLASDPNVGELVTSNGVPSGSAMQARLAPIGVDGRRVSPTAWVDLASDPIVTPGSAPDTVAPGAPTGLTASDVVQGAFLAWTNPADADLDKIEIWENTVDSQPDPVADIAMRIGSATGLPGSKAFYSRHGLSPGDQRWYWLRAVDRAGNVSGFNATPGATATALGLTVIADTTAPAAPTGLTASAAYSSIFLEMTAPADTDTDKIEIWENTVNTQPNPVTDLAKRINTIAAAPSATITFARSGLAVGVTRFYWVRAVDQSGNVSGFNATGGASATTGSVGAQDLATGTLLAAPTGLTLNSAVVFDADQSQIVTITASWTAVTDTYGVLSFYELAVKEGSGSYITHPVAGSDVSTILRGMRSGQTYTAKVRAVDRNGNRTGYSSTQTVTGATDSLAPKAPTSFSATGGVRGARLSWTNPSQNTDNSALTDLDQVAVYRNSVNNSSTAALVGTANGIAGTVSSISFSGLTTGDQWYYWLKAVDTSGNASAFSGAASVTIPEVDYFDLAADSVRAANILAGEIVGGHFNTSTSLPGTITVGVTGVSIGTVESRASDPAARVNANATTINPGKVLISGSTTLSNWRDGTDNTKIYGGSIAGNTIAVNSAVIGLRGVDIAGLLFAHNSPSANQVAWTAGTVIYQDDTGAPATASISASNATWSTGTLYVYWVKGATTLSSTTSAATAQGANNIVFAVYQGGTNLVATYGRTTIDNNHIATDAVDARTVKSLSLSAVHIISNSLSADRIVVNDIDTQYLKNGSLVQAGVIDYAPGSPLLVTAIGAGYQSVSGAQIVMASRSSATGDKTVIHMTLFMDVVNLEAGHSAGFYCDIIWSDAGGGSGTIVGASVTISPNDSATFSVPLILKSGYNGNVTLVPGVYAVNDGAGGVGNLVKIRRMKLIPTALYKGS